MAIPHTKRQRREAMRRFKDWRALLLNAAAEAGATDDLADFAAGLERLGAATKLLNDRRIGPSNEEARAEWAQFMAADRPSLEACARLTTDAADAAYRLGIDLAPIPDQEEGA